MRLRSTPGLQSALVCEGCTGVPTCRPAAVSTGGFDLGVLDAGVAHELRLRAPPGVPRVLMRLDLLDPS